MNYFVLLLVVAVVIAIVVAVVHDYKKVPAVRKVVSMIGKVIGGVVALTILLDRLVVKKMVDNIFHDYRK
ncbi:TPA: hypothetical protein TUM69_001658 [Streptococcus equi subsp. zooepidemicus]|nr:hypothetical protein [Streptococcus equi subsp. zooepidemicus]HEL0429295.1 hypothetical protein [Streptococcus equi subsp. zooepidemicus]HEL0431430.1 hypothetical protein [Streptococcus equi subsp. zooepidemicus]HEL0435555.1 hypothetical protein [Streptococcus equi subsp. zooepidemicus]HEL0439667.1 hypothetical protein [Streptococcus equi subsp. zooepidemicus]